MGLQSDATGGNANVTDFIASIGAGVYAPLFTGGALDAQVDIVSSDQKAALALYGQALLTAFREVEDAIDTLSVL